MILEWKLLRNIIEVRSFLGLAGYYGRFVKGFSMIVALMTRLLQKNVRFESSEKCQASFENSKAFLAKAPVLTQATFGKGICDLQRCFIKWTRMCPYARG